MYIRTRTRKITHWLFNSGRFSLKLNKDGSYMAQQRTWLPTASLISYNERCIGNDLKRALDLDSADVLAFFQNIFLTIWYVISIKSKKPLLSELYVNQNEPVINMGIRNKAYLDPAGAKLPLEYRNPEILIKAIQAHIKYERRQYRLSLRNDLKLRKVALLNEIKLKTINKEKL